jgi:type 1 glutamine amidotransferase
MNARVATTLAIVLTIAAGLGTGASPEVRAQAPQGARGGGPGGSQFAGQTPINAMIITGGCCHDYTGQTKVLMDTINAVMPVHWTVVQGMTSLPEGRLPLFDHADWARGQDIVIHNECWANVTLSPQAIRHITEAGVPRMFFHCALHSYRVMADDGWRAVIGADSRRHTRSHNMAITWAEDHPITSGLPPFVTPIDELYVIEREWPGFTALATAVSPEEGNPRFPTVWAYTYRGDRVFGTTLGHGNETWHTNQFREVIVRGFRWALEREPVALPPPAPPARGGGAGRGRGGVQ